MIASSDLNERVSLWIFIVLFAVSTVASQTTEEPAISCSSSQLLCGESICYDPATQYCTELGAVIQCIAACGNQCYNPSTQLCFNGTVCSLGQQLCVTKYDSNYGSQYNPPRYQCYDPTYQACFNNTLCSYPSRSCNQRCLLNRQVCVNNVTVCNTTDSHISYKPNQIKLCNGVCYDSATEECTNDIIQCINNCSDQCYNSSSHQCFNGTICSLVQQLCVIKYDSNYGSQYNPPRYQCYDPTYQACFNNTLCSYPSRSCNEQCLLNRQVCVNNVTVCNTTNSYISYKPNQIKLCNGVCYDSATQQCVDEFGVHCIRDPSTQQCINQSSNSSQFPNTTSISTINSSTVTTPTPPASSNCCANKECTNDADCCVQGTECQCYRHSNQDYGSCLNPYIEPLCANGCLTQQQCRNDTDCCKCQCGQVTVTNTNGTSVTRKQCVSR